MNDDNLEWLQDNNELQLRICTVGNCGASEHREVNIDTALNSIKSFCRWSDMEANAQAFCFSYLPCHATENLVIPRPLGVALHGTTCNEVFHFDFIFKHPLNSKSNHTFHYDLITKDSLSGFVESFSSSSPDHFVVADELIDWFKKFGLLHYLVSE